jgi:hypothetical protein
MIDERDETIERAARTLSALPAVRAGALARVVMAVRAHRARPVPAWRRALRWTEDTSVPARVAGLLVAASLVIGFVVRGTIGAPAGSLPAAPAAVAMAPAADAGAVPVALALELANARAVSVVGDFNGWDPAATPMQRVGANGPWSATFLARPGRHTYAYLVDGTTLMVDPRAPKTRSADFGGDASVLMVRSP